MALLTIFSIMLSDFFVMPLTYSISNGIGAGFITYVFIKLVRGRGARSTP